MSNKKFALVVGASGAIGQAICRRLAHDGWSLYLQYYKGQARIDALYAELASTYGEQEFMTVQADFSVQDGAEQLASSIFSLHAIVFANGQAHYGMLEDTSVEVMDALWRVHVQNPMRLCSLLSSKLRQTNGAIVVIGSIWGEAGASFEVAYSAVKGAQHAFVKAYAQEVAPSIRVNAILPGLIETGMNAHLTDEEQQMLLDDIPMQRAGQPEEVAHMVAFYIGDETRYVTGQCVRMNGGWYI